MANNSSTGGYLAPQPTPAPLEGKALSRFLQQFMVGVSGMDGETVRPRWQAEPPNIPPAFNAWASIGVASRPSDTYPYVAHDPTGDGTDVLYRQETLNILASFYDTGADGKADENLALFRDGLSIAQNLEALTVAGFAFGSCGDPIAIPALTKERWLYRADLPFVLRRTVTRRYGVLNVLSSKVFVTVNDPNGGVFSFEVDVNPPS